MTIGQMCDYLIGNGIATQEEINKLLTWSLMTGRQ
jgi:hypothetical protein